MTATRSLLPPQGIRQTTACAFHFAYRGLCATVPTQTQQHHTQGALTGQSMTAESMLTIDWRLKLSLIYSFFFCPSECPRLPNCRAHLETKQFPPSCMGGHGTGQTAGCASYPTWIAFANGLQMDTRRRKISFEILEDNGYRTTLFHLGVLAFPCHDQGRGLSSPPTPLSRSRSHGKYGPRLRAHWIGQRRRMRRDMDPLFRSRVGQWTHIRRSVPGKRTHISPLRSR
ncbi:hypothetical protein LZ32DRAFT_309853 [Colletotrichum eremochloae]|nr:hypothetical protein LZ32DRAFT_309853 [Colletotrichum eremochloae]